jgi:hypothetical protein
MDTLDIKAPAQARKDRVVPQGYTVFDELTALRQLMEFGRLDEAKQRFDRLLLHNEKALRGLDRCSAWSW